MQAAAGFLLAAAMHSGDILFCSSSSRRRAYGVGESSLSDVVKDTGVHVIREQGIRGAQVFRPPGARILGPGM